MFFFFLQSFEESVEKVNKLKETPSNDDLLELYGFYKQATVGDVNTGIIILLMMFFLNSVLY